jgi:hypothetical protein
MHLKKKPLSLTLEIIRQLTAPELTAVNAGIDVGTSLCVTLCCATQAPSCFDSCFDSDCCLEVP